MRLIRFGSSGAERPGLWKDGRIVDLRRHFPEMPDIGESFFRDGWLAKVAGVADEGRSMDVRLGPPVARPSKLICLGKNYLEHAQEGNFDAPEKPLLFAKAPSALSGPRDPIILPRSCGQVDWEVELALVVGREGKRISRDRAWDYIAGYAVMNDVSGREAQFGDGQWFRGKSFDTFAPLGPALVTPDEIEDIGNLQLTATVDESGHADGQHRRPGVRHSPPAGLHQRRHHAVAGRCHLHRHPGRCRHLSDAPDHAGRRQRGDLPDRHAR
jgi:2,4-diketo-3-deoxy-L-fuconate hydrolase